MELENIINRPARQPFDIQEYWKRNKIVGKYGVPYLDKELLGISKSDLVVIGARSGSGKSSLARIIYESNDKTKTALFSLENYSGDIEMSMIRKLYNEKTKAGHTSREWQTNKMLWIDKKKLDETIKEVNESLDGAYIFGRTVRAEDGSESPWTIKELADKIVWCATRGVNLIIIDHLDYLDKDNPDESDNSHVTALMKAIRQAQEIGAAVVAFSHLRKPIGKVDDLVVPNENEFIGSSNKVKQATQVIMFAPANEGNDVDGYGTWCCIRKNRNGGIKNRAAKLKFIPRTEEYAKDYEEYIINYAGTKTHLICDGETTKLR